MRIIFNAGFLAGAIIICAALILMFIPTGLFTSDKLSDHSTFLERIMEKREQRRKKAYEFLFIGIIVIVITGLIELALAA